MAKEQYFETHVEDGAFRYIFQRWVYTYQDGHQEIVERRTYL